MQAERNKRALQETLETLLKLFVTAKRREPGKIQACHGIGLVLPKRFYRKSLEIPQSVLKKRFKR